MFRLYAGSGSQDPSAREKMMALELAVINPVSAKLQLQAQISTVLLLLCCSDPGRSSLVGRSPLFALALLR